MQRGHLGPEEAGFWLSYSLSPGLELLCPITDLQRSKEL